ncbi:Vacuolar ATP synthase subunit C [Umbelopsis sp. WA50703]
MDYHLVSVPASGNRQNTLQNLKGKLSEVASTSPFSIPEFKIGTLDALVLLSDELVKYDASIEQTVMKTVDIMRSLLKDQESQLPEYLKVNDKDPESYVRSFQWNTMKYRTDKSLQETTELLNQEVSSADNVMKNKMNSYTQTKNALQAIQRKQTGNLSVKNLYGIVKKEHCVLNSEYLTTLIVAVPKQSYKHWNSIYESLTQMVVPRSSIKIAEDNEYGLFTVTLFKRVVEEFTHKAREEKFVVRDFQYDETSLEKQKKEAEETVSLEREQQNTVMRLAKTNFSEVFSSWVHLKALRVFVESVLRYGLPPDFAAVVIEPKPKCQSKVEDVLMSQYGHLGGVYGQRSKKGEPKDESLDHEFQNVNDSSYKPWVQFEIRFDPIRK